MTDTIRVMLVDDHDMVRRGLAAFLNVKEDLELVGEARSGTEAINICEVVQPDVILMDLVMPGVDGAAATRTIRQQWPQIQVVALTSFQEKRLIREVLLAGAIGYLLKNVSVDELATAIRAAHAGQSTLAPEAMQALIQSSPPDHELKPGHDLTPREHDVLALLVEGMSNPEIGRLMGIDYSTV